MSKCAGSMWARVGVQACAHVHTQASAAPRPPTGHVPIQSKDTDGRCPYTWGCSWVTPPSAVVSTADPPRTHGAENRPSKCLELHHRGPATLQEMTTNPISSLPHVPLSCCTEAPALSSSVAALAPRPRPLLTVKGSPSSLLAGHTVPAPSSLEDSVQHGTMSVTTRTAVSLECPLLPFSLKLFPTSFTPPAILNHPGSGPHPPLSSFCIFQGRHRHNPHFALSLTHAQPPPPPPPVAREGRIPLSLPPPHPRPPAPGLAGAGLTGSISGNALESAGEWHPPPPEALAGQPLGGPLSLPGLLGTQQRSAGGCVGKG